jgi:hypothetical protein
VSTRATAWMLSARSRQRHGGGTNGNAADRGGRADRQLGAGAAGAGRALAGVAMLADLDRGCEFYNICRIHNPNSRFGLWGGGSGC